MDCDTQTTLTMIACILVIAYLDLIDQSFPQLQNLFDDRTNLIMLSILVVLIVLVNIPVGVMIMVVVGYMKHYYDEKRRNIKVNNNQLKVKESFNDTQVKQYENSHVQPDTNVVKTNETSQNNTYTELKEKVNKDIEEIVDKRMNKPLLNNKEMLTQVGPNDRHGYDIAGCRYDMKNSHQNLTKYGPPLSSCNVYTKENIEKQGTAFYPLNG